MEKLEQQSTVKKAMEAAAARGELTVRMDMAKLHCPRCNHPFKPPIYQFLCDAGHLACSNCHGQLPKDKCYACGHDGAYRRNTTLEDVVGWHKVLCPNGAYGCQAYVPTTSAATTSASAPARRAAARSRAAPSPARRRCSATTSGTRMGGPWTRSRRRLLVAEEEGRVFLVVAVGAPGECPEVSLACLRANAAAEPQYTCRMWAVGEAAGTAGALSVMMKMEVPSCGVPGKAAVVPLVVHRKMLHGASTEIHLSVRIDEELDSRSNELDDLPMQRDYHESDRDKEMV
ncbi:uncharacterized protein LOC120709654 [Panicum virgatum]|uniref:uncharacterized protein LOC120709654 n=1 Tax=Panicum virgatum TaxID=38727 RepID=UPI0019D627C7|nr:uncharacterized protein LOC120709654 [Panicum virgatum]